MLKWLKEFFSGANVPVGTVNEIVMYSTRLCPYCVRARGLFGAKGWEFQEIAVDMNPEKRAEMTARAGRQTVPQIWIGNKHIGGCDDLFRLEVKGQLEQLVMGVNDGSQ